MGALLGAKELIDAYEVHIRHSITIASAVAIPHGDGGEFSHDAWHVAPLDWPERRHSRQTWRYSPGGGLKALGPPALILLLTCIGSSELHFLLIILLATSTATATAAAMSLALLYATGGRCEYGQRSPISLSSISWGAGTVCGISATSIASRST